MRPSEYQTQAYVNQGLDRQHSLDSPEGSAALVQANKPEVDATDSQKEQILAKDDVRFVATQELASDNRRGQPPRPIIPMQSMVNPFYKKK